MYKIIGADGKEYGPVSADQLRQWLADGRADAQTRTRLAEGGPDWKPLAEFPEFQPASVSAAPPLLPPTMPSPPKTIGLAITSLVLGILSLTCFSILAGIPAVICGILAINRITRSRGALGGQGQAIAGLVTGSLSILMIPVLAGMLLPALSVAQEKARRVQCLNELRQLSLGLSMYVDDNREKLPVATQWCDGVKKYVSGTDKIFRCPSDRTGGYSYAFNANLSGGPWWHKDELLVVLIDAPRGWNGALSGPAELPPSPHRAGYNVLFTDGHVEFVLNDRVRQLHWVPEKK